MTLQRNLPPTIPGYPHPRITFNNNLTPLKLKWLFNINNNSKSIKLLNWFFRGIGHADMWEKCIYPGMRQSIICTLLASQEHMDRSRNCFELYGADFMLGEDFSPWLIEINSCPCMQPTTSVTARMCSQCLEDVIKGRLSTAANTTYKNYWHCLELHKCKYLLTMWLKTSCRWSTGYFNKPTKRFKYKYKNYLKVLWPCIIFGCGMYFLTLHSTVLLEKLSQSRYFLHFQETWCSLLC